MPVWFSEFKYEPKKSRKKSYKTLDFTDCTTVLKFVWLH